MQPDTPGVRIDIAHADLLYGLVRAQKPQRVLEFGFGGGRSAEAILRALDSNHNDAQYLMVDNWADWSGVMPPEARQFFCERPQVQFSQMDEGEFVRTEAARYDFIMSDADHTNTHRWFEDVYDRLLAPGGILVYHDVRSFPNIGEIEASCVRDGLRHAVFEKNSVDGEACGRGLLVIFKGPQE